VRADARDDFLEALFPVSRRDSPRDHTARVFACERCQADFVATKGEIAFARVTGIEPFRLCRWCRPTRREALALGLPR